MGAGQWRRYGVVVVGVGWDKASALWKDVSGSDLTFIRVQIRL